MWVAAAALAMLAIGLAGHLAFPYLRNALMGPAYALILPAVAWLHARHKDLRASGSVLATVSGTAHVTAAMAGTLNVDAQPAAIFLLGVWWWTNGKMWAETATLPRAFGVTTAALAPVALLASFAAAASAPLSAFGTIDVSLWDVTRVALAAWLLALAGVLARDGV